MQKCDLEEPAQCWRGTDRLLQEGWLPAVLPGALREWEVTEVEQGIRHAEPAVIANGANLGKVRWIEPPETCRQDNPVPPPDAPGWRR
jgi:hypothetical protein